MTQNQVAESANSADVRADAPTVISNHVPRDIINAWELTPAERADFDYIDWAAIEEGRDSASFFRYKGDLYDLGDCETPTMPGTWLSDWHGFYSQTFFSGVLFRYCADFEQVIVARYYA